MKSIIEVLVDKFCLAVQGAFPEEDIESLISFVEVTQSTQEKFGHYQCNAAMKLAKLLKTNPRAIADALVEKVDRQSDGMIQSLEVAGPGFINIVLKKEFLAKRVEDVLTHSHLGIDLPVHARRIVLDFSSPNIAKEMHVGHLRSTIIGDSLARVFEFLGHDVLRLNHVGDWGTQFGMLIAYMKEEASEVLSGEKPTDLGHLVSWYKAAKWRFDRDLDFQHRSKKEVVALQGGEVEALQAWEEICRVSEEAYQEIYDLLDVKLEIRGESFYNPMLADVVADLEAKGLVTISSGAKCIFLEGFENREGEPLPLIVQKSDGGYNYVTTDMAALRHRVEEERADRIIYVTDAGQATHFKMVFTAAQKAGYFDPNKVRIDHVPFGLVLGPDGKKFKTRSGETEKLIDLLKAAVSRAYEILQERQLDMSDDEMKVLAQALGIGAIKYADLSCHRSGDYVFSYDRMLRFEGNTAAFLMYSYVRVAGIKRKVGVDVDDMIACGESVIIEHPSEEALALHILQFGEALALVANELLPNRLTDYLYELAQKFNAFFRDCRVEGSDRQASRLMLCEATACIMGKGLDLLGIQTVIRM